MRLSWHELSIIKRKILNDLYEKSELAFSRRQDEIVQQNREYYFESIQHLLDQLPDEIIAKNTRYVVKICYLPPGTSIEDTLEIVNKTWEISGDSIPNPTSLGNYSKEYPTPNKLDSRLYNKTKILCDEMIVIQKEKHDMEKFLHSTTEQYSGTLQLRAVWPASLHKYLPPEPTKQAKVNKQKQKAAKAIIPAVPKNLTNRLTTNLLEG